MGLISRCGLANEFTGISSVLFEAENVLRVFV
jgi:hypothetical protein